jgi:hypothetical protein
MNHPHISPLLAWFHACTAKYGLAFDPFSELPTSRQGGDLKQDHEHPAETATSASPQTTDESDEAQVTADQSVGEAVCGLQLLPDMAGKVCREGAGSWQCLQEQQLYLQQQAQSTANAFYFYQQPMNAYYHS